MKLSGIFFTVRRLLKVFYLSSDGVLATQTICARTPRPHPNSQG